MASAAILADVESEFTASDQVRVRAFVENCTEQRLTLTFKPSAGGKQRTTDRSIGPGESTHYDFFFGGFGGARRVEGCVELVSATPG